MNAFSFGSYLAGDSFIHKLDPRTKLVLGFSFLITLLFVRNFAVLGICAVIVLGLFLLAHLPFKKVLRSTAPLMVIAVFAAIVNLFTIQGGNLLFELGILRISEAGVYQCFFIAVRILLMLFIMSLVTMTTMTLEITEAAERMLKPLERLRLPIHELAMIMGIALRFLPQFAQEFQTIYHAQISRGVQLSHQGSKVRVLASFMIPLFTSIFRHAETLALAMDARCYHGGKNRTRLRPLHFSWRDGVATGLLVLIIVAVSILNAGLVSF